MLTHGFSIDSASDVELLTTPHQDIDRDMLCGVPLSKRGVLLDPDEVAALREWAAENVRYGIIRMNFEVAKELLGLEECDPSDTAPFCKIGETYYVARNNTHNRALSAARLGSDTKQGYVYDILARLWGFADPIIIGADGMIGSAQHRAMAVIKAYAIDPSLGALEFPVIWGIPPQFIDFIDRGKVRDPKDMEFRDATNFTDDLIDECGLSELTAEERAKFRTKWSSTLVAASNNIYVRCEGQNVHPSKAQAPSERERLKVQQRFQDEHDLQRLILRVYASSRGMDGKPLAWTKVFTPTQLVTAMVLHCNDSHSDKNALTLDWDYVDMLLNAMADSVGDPETGPFGPSLADIMDVTKKIKAGGGSRPNDREVFGCLVTAIKQYYKDNTTDKVWQGKRDRKKAANDKTYRCFGGVDTGYVDPKAE